MLEAFVFTYFPPGKVDSNLSSRDKDYPLLRLRFCAQQTTETVWLWPARSAGRQRRVRFERENSVRHLILAIAALCGLVFLAPAAQALDVREAQSYSVPADKVWAAIRDFCSLKEWHPAIADCTQTAKNGVTRRTLVTGDGAKIKEVRHFHSDKTMTVTYSIVESPLPVIDYISTMTVTSDGSGKTEFIWQGRFAAPEGKDKDATDIIRSIYRAGLDNLAKKLAN